jgi:cellulose synthase/poly-beta-1,6-N-acetylglucosamine synthase-like glycosyltransferase
MLSFIFAFASFLLVLPAFSLLALTLASLRSKTDRPMQTFTTNDVSMVIMVPAHNESTHLLPTLQSITRQMGPNDRLLVVADNCTDDTAEVARSFGAETIERFNGDLRGKGFALAFGVDHLRLTPPDVVAIVDADCLLSDNALQQLSMECHTTGRPVQMLYLMTTAGPSSALRFRVIEFALLMKNKIRPLGSFVMGNACHLMGSGMALPWKLIETSNLATGHIAEDMKLGIELTRQGKAPRFLSSVHTYSPFMEESTVIKGQKSRWEHGHMAVTAEELPQLLWQSIRQRQAALIVLAMDLMIPPIALYFMLLSALIFTSGLGSYFLETAKPMAWIAMSGFAALSLSVLIGWSVYGRHLLSVRELLTTPLYALWKLPVYIAFFMKKRSGWKRTDRDKK